MKLSEHIKKEMKSIDKKMIEDWLDADSHSNRLPVKFNFSDRELIGKLLNPNIKSFLEKSLKSSAYKSKEDAFDVLMTCMPKSAENINTITPEDARKMLQDFVKKYWYKDE